MPNPLLRQIIELPPYSVILEEDHIEVSDDGSEDDEAGPFGEREPISVVLEPQSKHEACQVAMALRLAAKRMDQIAERIQ